MFTDRLLAYSFYALLTTIVIACLIAIGLN